MGKELLLDSASQGSELIDPTELAAGLWLSERLSAPWPRQVEDLAREELLRLQRADGGFAARRPEYNSNGHAHYASSVHTIRVLTQYLVGPPATRRSERCRNRLHRWRHFVESGAKFIVDSVVGDAGLVGWQSDRHPEAARIDCRVTARAVRTLCALDRALAELGNHDALQGLTVDWPEPKLCKAIPLDCDKLRRQGSRAHKELAALGMIRSVAALRKQTEEFVTLEGSDESHRSDEYSVMLFGPPGTGKTHRQSIVAGELGWPVVTITIGDFLREGEDKVGKVAVDLFTRLNHASRCCIVFEEFDEMVVERAAHKDETPSSFRLLTPAMLPLLSDLRAKAPRQHCLVAFNTNYVAYIDPAARRAGRVDDSQPLMYAGFVSRVLFGIHHSNLGSIRKQGFLTELGRIASRTAICSYPVLSRALDQFGADPKGEKQYRHAISPDYYSSGLENHEVMQELTWLKESVGSAGAIDEFLAQFEPSRRRAWERFLCKDAQRLNKRVVLSTPTDVGHDGQSLIMVDFSRSGALIRSDADLPTGSDVRLRVPIVAKWKPVLIEGVVHGTRLNDSYGVEFKLFEVGTKKRKKQDQAIDRMCSAFGLSELAIESPPPS